MKRKSQMAEQLIVKNSITINAPASAVWDALINPEKTKQYMFGCETVSDWKVDSELLWRGQYEGNDIVYVKGKIVEIQPEKLLIYTTIDPNSSIEDVPENYVDVTYELVPQEGKTVLNISQGDFSTVADGESRYKDSYNNGDGWNPILVEIKKLVENS
ncbi:SRPBCC domain-containing protein [Dyadobacter fanqingshengii]|uniref:SRPBCC domain-containing protein n=1 Tax=Dyadobacter fanqingshengii TaxID=2906443 RepID=A0A9X1T9A1_9BACT|nr:SRPBCC domain-containing protein [Dyadobacter fanqingshengii]MCF0041015.1 SRPBCC domain-containing protein [Dyadobacter fanqingshengii]USJ37254.1 SRPBCC domain-containing protein [Dyadobacter fanqingshengii]